MSENLSDKLKDFIATQLADLKGQVSSKDEDIALLRNQLNEMKMEKKSQPSSSSCKTTATFSEETIHRSKASTSKSSRHSAETPSKSSSKPHSTPTQSRSTPLKTTSRSSKNIKPPTLKRHPCQLQERELEDSVKPVKGAVPQAPDPQTLKEFYSCFTTQSDIESVLANSSSRAIIAQNKIQTLNDNQLTQKAGRETLHLKEIHIMFIHSSLAKLGLRRWGPNLSEATNSLLNSACRISAILAFCQVAAGGAFDTANMEATYINNLRNHHRLEFAKAMKYPKRYLNFLDNIASHSDNEPSKDGHFWIIRKLEYRSKKATVFLRRLDQDIATANPALIKPTQFCTCRVPLLHRKSLFNRPPQRCSLNTLSPAYFNSLPQHLKFTLADTKKFIKKYYDRISAPYTLESVKTSSSLSSSEEDEDLRGKGKAKAKVEGKAKAKAKAKGSNNYDDTDYGTGIGLSNTLGEDEEEAYYQEGEFEDDFLDSDEDKDSEEDEDFDPTKQKTPSSGDESSNKANNQQDDGDKSAMIINDD
ncbi:uncharacterized protein MELLADRAFT_61518 [Melampsora larici-populina 98AG31]|uniref:Uncharacterized protein n=1 Tax=Melampsora larici-populina (strain 98AG31 / pathotype 3-4-7) TaxID=747676 RepID=F4RF85_MELLP|nr:uncharacterized protein MELLADRAFT_61518 [Melampsora larici-populina 98AG31]EGG08768.1 hypothetical protein MELLADRAFT_61518 [Melampsora larici-populina 98AG31]